MSQQHKPVRIAVVGCGAVTQGFHLPVLAGHDGVTIAALVDPDMTRAQRLATLYRVPAVFPSADHLDRTVADAALVATPAFLHAPGSIDLLNRGLHVLVEKPMALTLADGERMVSTARDRGLVLTVGLFRRLLPAIRLFRATLDAGEIGDLLNVSAEVGDAYTWQLTTLAGMRRQEAGGGMLLDMGSHLLDLVLYVCDATPALLQYADNAGAGIETDCTIELGLSRRGTFVPAHMELSRTRKLRNSIRVEGSRGTIEWSFGERAKVRLQTPSTFVDTLTASPRECTIEARWRDEPEQQGYEGFRAQIDDFVGAINGDHEPQLSGASVLPSVELMEQCYTQRVALPEPWFTEQLTPIATAHPPTRAKSHTVLVTGASGFIGCRLSERLHFGSDWHVKAMIRNPGRAVRLARMPVDFAIGDLASPSDLAKALDGCEAVVHAGIGTSWRRAERIATNVQGTKNLVDAALRAGVKRFVHISTISLYGNRVTGIITEETPARPTKGWDYAESKYAAEQVVLEAATKGLPAVVLRVAAVYGPHNMTITARPLWHLVEGRLFLAGCDNVPSNTIYIDNLCHGIQLALDGGPDLNGQTFLLSDDDGSTWGDYFGYFAERVGATVHHVPKPERETASVPSQPSLPMRWLRSTRDLVMSPEVKALARRVYLADPWGTPARWGIDRFPAAAEKLKRLIRPEEGFVYHPARVAKNEVPPFTVDAIDARVSTEKASRVLGYQPVVARQRAMELTLAWARHARLVPDRSREEREAIAARR